MSKVLARRKRRDEQGAAVAEYAAVTIAALALGFLLVTTIKESVGGKIIGAIFNLATGIIGL